MVAKRLPPKHPERCASNTILDRTCLIEGEVFASPRSQKHPSLRGALVWSTEHTTTPLCVNHPSPFSPKGPSSALSTGLHAGQIMFERFVLISQLPGAAANDLWTVTDLQTHQSCAMELYPAVALTVPAWTENLKQAATSASQLQHPNLARLLDLRVTPQYTAAIWTGGTGQNLSTLIAQEPAGRIAFSRAALWLEQLAAALDHLHGSTGLAHGSLCPRRVIVTNEGPLQVAHSCVINTLREIVMQSGGQWESSDELPYLSPQRWEGFPLNPADDVYAFGCIAYGLLTGKPPFYEGDIAQQARMTSVTPIFLQQSAQGASIDDVPAPWQAFIDACLAKDSAKRPKALLPMLQSAIQQSAPPPPRTFPFGGVPQPAPQTVAPAATSPAAFPPLPALPPTPLSSLAAAPAAPAPPAPPAPIIREEIAPAVALPPPPAAPVIPPPPPPVAPPAATPSEVIPVAPPPPPVASAPSSAKIPPPPEPAVQGIAPAPSSPASSGPAPVAPSPSPRTPPAVPTKKPETFDPYSKHTKPVPRGLSPQKIIAVVVGVVVLGGGWFFWQNWSSANALREQSRAKLDRAQELLNTEKETEALALMREALALTPQDTEISGQIQRIEDRALVRELEAYNNELRSKGTIQAEAAARALLQQTLARDPTHASARALKLNLEIQQERLEAARKAAEAAALAEAATAKAAALEAARATENASVQVVTEQARRKLEIAELKLLVLRNNTPEKSFAARNALDQLRLLAPNDPDLADLEARLRDPAKSAAQPAVINMDSPAVPAPKPSSANAAPRVAEAAPARSTPARMLTGNPPDYPRDQLRTQRGGEVDVVFTVDVDGSVKEPKIIRSTHIDFSTAVLKAVRTYRFEPATLNGKPVPAQVAMPFNFTP